VGVVSRHLTDPSRRNRYGVSTNGSFMVSVWYPAVAAAGKFPALFEHPELTRDPTVVYGSWTTYLDRLAHVVGHAQPDVPCATESAPYPLLLYSPGLNGDHAHAGERGPYFASHGYVVIGIEHFDCYASIFPDGMQVRATAMGTAGPPDRVRDMGFILDELTCWNASDPQFAGRLDLGRVAAMGVSLGGGTVAEFAATDPRCKAIIALAADPDVPLRVPLLQITTAGGGNTLYDLACGDAIWFQLNGAAHQQGGTDFYWLIYPDPVGLAFCRETSRTMIAYELWFLNKYLKGETGPSLPLPGFPLVTGFKQK
jgi:predicted dienelactone hydrolase